MTKFHNKSSTINHPCTLPHGIIVALFRLILLHIFLLSLPMAAAQQVSSGGDTVNTNNVSPSMSVIVIVLVLVFIVTGTVSIYLHQCGENSSPSAPPIVISGAVDVRSRRGSDLILDKSAIDTFPTFLYSAVKELKVGKGSLECAVCLNEFEEDETLRLLPKCDHVFHRDCIDVWLAGHITCPVCRANLVPETDHTGYPADSTHGIDLDIEMEASSSGEENNQRCEVQITIKDDGTASEEHDPKRKSDGKFPRSHSTGHSMSRPGEDLERYTLRLPAEVRRQLMARTKLKRATSLVALPRASSSRHGYRAGDGEGSGSSRYGRLFGRFLLPRMGSFRSNTKIAGDGDVTAGSVSSKRLVRTAVTPLESLPSLPV